MRTYVDVADYQGMVAMRIAIPNIVGMEFRTKIKNITYSQDQPAVQFATAIIDAGVDLGNVSSIQIVS